jgi:hypothetical protein
MFKIRSDLKLSNPNPIRVLKKNSNPIQSEEFFNKINFSFKLKYLTKKYMIVKKLTKWRPIEVSNE